MNVVDVVLIIFLLFGFLVGWMRGFSKQILAVVGLIFSVILAFLFKDNISALLYKVCPFFEFGGYFDGVTALNLVIYETIAFLLLFGVLLIICKIIVSISSFIEKILNATIILGLPGKILGGIAGVIENFVIAFIVLYVLNLPLIDFPLVKNSSFGNKILNSTPVMSDICSDTLTIYDEIKELKDKYSKDENKTNLNNEIVKLLIKHKVVSSDNINYLIEKEKLKNVTIEV